jgi:Pentatricopeptide repeat domain
LNKADRAMNLFREMKQLYESGNHEHLKPNVVAYNAVLNACAFCDSDPGGLHQSSHAMEMAHAILKEVENSSNPFDVKPDQVTYGTFLKVCANHLPDCSTRQQIVEMILRRCQRDGLVGNLVLQQLRSMVSDPDLYQNLVGKSQDQEISVEDLPPSWWRNVVESKQRWRKQQRPWS